MQRSSPRRPTIPAKPETWNLGGDQSHEVRVIADSDQVGVGPGDLLQPGIEVECVLQPVKRLIVATNACVKTPHVVSGRRDRLRVWKLGPIQVVYPLLRNLRGFLVSLLQVPEHEVLSEMAVAVAEDQLPKQCCAWVPRMWLDKVFFRHCRDGRLQPVVRSSRIRFDRFRGSVL